MCPQELAATSAAPALATSPAGATDFTPLRKRSDSWTDLFIHDLAVIFRPLEKCPWKGKRSGLQDPLLIEVRQDALEAGLEAQASDDTLSLRETASSVLNAMVGISVLSLPYAFSLIGTVAGLVALLVVVGVMSHTALLIGRALELTARIPELASIPPKARDFAFLAHAAFGEKGRTFIGLVTGAELWFALVTFMAFNVANLELLFPTTSRTAAMACSSGVAAISTLVPMRAYSQMSMVSSLAVLVMGLAVIATCATSLWHKLNSAPDIATIEVSQLFGSLWAEFASHAGNLPRSLGIIIFCFAGHPCFPVMHESLRERKDWDRVVNIAFFISLLYYSGFGCAGSLAFGHNVKPSVAENLMTEPSAELWRYIAATSIVIKVQLTAPLFLKTILVALWPPPSEKDLSVERTGSKNVQWAVALIVLSAMTGTIALVFADKVAVLASLAGSLLVMVTSVLFPILVFQRLSNLLNEQRHLRQRFMHFLMLALGVLMAVIGTLQAVNDLRTGHSGP